MTDLPRHSVSVAGVVFDQHDRVLAIRRRDNGQWQPPGGVLELGETFARSSKRPACTSRSSGSPGSTVQAHEDRRSSACVPLHPHWRRSACDR